MKDTDDLGARGTPFFTTVLSLLHTNTTAIAFLLNVPS